MNGTATTPVRPLPEDMLDVRQVAALCRVATVTVRRWCDSAKLKSYRVGGSRRIYRSDLLDFIDRGEAVRVDPAHQLEVQA